MVSRMRAHRRYALPLLAVAALAAGPVSAAPPVKAGVVPEGIWVLNQQRSKKFVPGEQTLWIVKDDGQRLVWVAVATDPKGEIKLNTWDGRYDAAPTEVIGTGMMSQVTSPRPGKFLNHGTIPGVGTYKEDCDIPPDGKRFVCRGEVTTPQGVQEWIDDFDWVGPGPGR